MGQECLPPPGPVYYAVKLASYENGDLTPLLEDRVFVDELERGSPHRNALRVACEKGNVKAVQRLLTAGANIEMLDPDGATALHTAADYGQLEVVRILLQRESVVAAKDHLGETPLMRAAWSGYEEVVKLLLSHGASSDVLITDKNDNLPLYYAAMGGSINVLQLLLARTREHGSASIFSLAGNGDSLLHAAARGTKGDIIQFLLAEGLDITATNDDGHNAFHLMAQNAFYWPFPEPLEAVLAFSGACGGSENYQAISQEILSFRDYRGGTLLHGAARVGNKKLIKLLLERGADVAAVDEERATPLHWAAGRDAFLTIAIVELLLVSGAQVDAADNEGYTPLHRAVQGPCGSEVARVLLQHGASISAATLDSQTPLHLAIRTSTAVFLESFIERRVDFYRVIELLIDDKASVDAFDNSKQTHSYLTAAGNRQEEKTIPRLLPSVDDAEKGDAESSSTVDARDSLGRTPLFIAARADRASVVRSLLARGKDKVRIHHRDVYGHTALDAAVRRGHSDVVELLLEASHERQIPAEQLGSSLLAWAKLTGNSQIIKMLGDFDGRLSREGANKDPPARYSWVPKPESGEILICDACCLNIVPAGKMYYHCHACFGGDFDLCDICFDRGFHCADQTHSLDSLGPEVSLEEEDRTRIYQGTKSDI